MPRAPGSNIPRFGQQPINAPFYNTPQVQAPPATAIPQQLVQQGQALEQFGSEVMKQAAIAGATESDNAFSESLRNLGSEYSQKLGRDAVQGFEETEKKARQQLRDIEARTTSPIEKRLIRDAGERRLQQFVDRATSHRDRQLGIWRESSAEAALKGAQLDYQADVQKGGDGATFRATALEEARKLSALRGEDEAQQRITLLATTTAMHGYVIDALVEQGKGFQALDHLNKHKDEIAPDFAVQRAERAKAAMLEESARAIDANPNLTTLGERKAAALELLGNSEDAAGAIRHLEQNEERRLNARALESKSVRAQLEQALRDNPRLIPADFPALNGEAQRLGVEVNRSSNNPDFVQFMRTEEGMRRLRMLSPERLSEELSNNLTPAAAADQEKLVRGDQAGYTISQLTRGLAIASGVIPAQSAYGQAGANEQKMLDWEKSTIAPMVDAIRTKLGRPLTVTEFQDMVVGPLTKDVVMVKATTLGFDSLASDVEMPVVAAQAQGFLPVDNPETRDVDESLDVKNANVYVTVDGQRVGLAQIPMQERRKIREAYRQEWIAQRGDASMMPQLSAFEEAARWHRSGRVGDRVKKPADQRIPGVGWGVQDLNQEDLPTFVHPNQDEQYIIPGIRFEQPK